MYMHVVSLIGVVAQISLCMDCSVSLDVGSWLVVSRRCHQVRQASKTTACQQKAQGST